jgi:hypothetical protein
MTEQRGSTVARWIVVGVLVALVLLIALIYLASQTLMPAS